MNKNENINHVEPKLIDIQEIDISTLRTYRKIGVTRARILTLEDFESCDGKIKTLEGMATFHVGDYLAVGVSGEEYPIRAETMLSTKRQVGQQDENGWAEYETTTTVKAVKMQEQFAVRRVETSDISVGKAGDYLVVSPKRQFIVDADIFAKTYVEVTSD